MELFTSTADVFFSTSFIQPRTEFDLFTQDSARGRETDERNATKIGYYGKLNSFNIQTNLRTAQTIEELIRDIPSKYYRMEYFLNIFDGDFKGGSLVGYVNWNLKANQNIIFIFYSEGEQWNFPGPREIKFTRNNIPIEPFFDNIYGYGVNFNVYCIDGCNFRIFPLQFKSSLTIKLTLYFKEYCSDFLDNPICINYCLNNIDDCIPGNIKYCINNSQPLNSKILDASSNCYSIISAYYSRNPDRPQILYDDAFTKLCSNLQVNPSNYKTYTGTNAIIDNRIREICACHLNPAVYDNYYQELTENVEVLQSLNLGTKQCLFPECSTSQFRSSATLGNNACKNVCLNVFNLKANGTFEELTIEQKNECQDIVRPIERCIDDSSCSEGKVCRNGICERGCNDDSGCQTYEKCIEGICEPFEICEFDYQCPSNKTCITGECILRGKCNTDNDCDNGFVCISGFCSQKEGIPRWAIGTIIGVGIFVVLLVIFIIYFIFKK